MKEILLSLGLTQNEIKVYLALLKLQKGTKTPIVRESKVLSSKIYEILDKLIERGLVTYFTENKVKQYVPVHPENVKRIFDEKIKTLTKQQEMFEKEISQFFNKTPSYETHVQVFRGWNGVESAMMILLSDLNEGEKYYILGANAGENFDRAMVIFPRIVREFDKKKVKRKVIFRSGAMKEANTFFEKFGKKGWNYRHYPTIGPLEIGIANNYVMLSLLEQDPVVTLVHNKRIRDSFMHYFETLWKISQKN